MFEAKYRIYKNYDEFNFNSEIYSFYTFVASLIFYLINRNKCLCIEWVVSFPKGHFRALGTRYNGDKEKWEF